MKMSALQSQESYHLGNCVPSSQDSACQIVGAQQILVENHDDEEDGCHIVRMLCVSHTSKTHTHKDVNLTAPLWGT